MRARHRSAPPRASGSSCGGRAWIAVVLGGLGLLAPGCGGGREHPSPPEGERVGTGESAAPHQGGAGAGGQVPGAPPESVQDPEEEAAAIFQARCAVCHGLQGRGDGPGAVALDPRPANYTDPLWQASVSDEEIEAAILRGGSAVGKSPLMVANPDLEGRPEVLGALRRRIRAFGHQEGSG